MERRKRLRAQPGGISKQWSHSLDRLVMRSRRKDYRAHQAKLVGEALAADKRNDKVESARIVRIIKQKPRGAHWNSQPTVSHDGSPIFD